MDGGLADYGGHWLVGPVSKLVCDTPHRHPGGGLQPDAGGGGGVVSERIL